MSFLESPTAFRGSKRGSQDRPRLVDFLKVAQHVGPVNSCTPKGGRAQRGRFAHPAPLSAPRKWKTENFLRWVRCLQWATRFALMWKYHTAPADTISQPLASFGNFSLVICINIASIPTPIFTNKIKLSYFCHPRGAKNEHQRPSTVPN